MNLQNVDIRGIAQRYPSHWYRHYAAAKLGSDPLYAAVADELRPAPDLPLLDVGCGLGIAAAYLRQAGYRGSILGIDYDEPKIATAQTVIGGWLESCEFRTGDARTLGDFQGNVLLLDVLQFLTAQQQTELLQGISKFIAPGGRLIVRSGVRERNLRFAITWAGDVFARATFWMKDTPRAYPTAAQIVQAFPAEEFLTTQKPLWGRTPFNNYLFVITRR